MASRPLNFPRLTPEEQRELYDRQQGMCAMSGEPLSETYQLHHIVPAGHGGNRTPEADAFVRDFRANGVLVNTQLTPESGYSADEGSPHLRAHGGHFSGPTAPHSAFEYSHGQRTAEHEAWALRGEELTESLVWSKEHGQEARTTGEPKEASDKLRSFVEARDDPQRATQSPNNELDRTLDPTIDRDEDR